MTTSLTKAMKRKKLNSDTTDSSVPLSGTVRAPRHNTSRDLVDAEKEIESLKREKADLAAENKTLWSHNMWLHKQNIEQDIKHNKKLIELRNMVNEASGDIEENTKKARAELVGLKLLLDNLQSVNDANKTIVRDAAVQVTRIEKRATLEATAHKEHTKALYLDLQRVNEELFRAKADPEGTVAKCSICMDEYSPTRHKTVLFPCGHTCCHTCAGSLNQQQPATCHLCRESITLTTRIFS